MTHTDGLSRAILEELLEAERDLRRQAERLQDESRKAVLELARKAASEMLDDLKKEKVSGLDDLPTPQLIALINDEIGRRLGELQKRVQRLDYKLGQLHAQDDLVDRLRNENAKLRRTLESPPRDPQPQKETEVPKSDQSSSVPQEREPTLSSSTRSINEDGDFKPYAERALWPDWFQEWVDTGLNDARRKQGFLTARTIIQVMGETGAPLRSTVTKTAAEKVGHSSSGGVEYRAIKRFRKMGLIKEHEARRGSITPYLIQLTEKGEMAHRLLYGRDPVEQEAARLLSLHSSPEHVYLIIEAQKILEKAGFHVERYFTPIPVPDGEYNPDLIATYKGTVIYVEAERDTYKKPGERQKKWRKAIHASGGELYLVFGTRAEIDPVLSRMLFTIGNINLAARIYAFATEFWVKKNDPIPDGFDVFYTQKNVR